MSRKPRPSSITAMRIWIEIDLHLPNFNDNGESVVQLKTI